MNNNHWDNGFVNGKENHSRTSKVTFVLKFQIKVETLSGDVIKV